MTKTDKQFITRLFKGLKGEFRSLKDEVFELHDGVNELHNEFKILKDDVHSLKGDVSVLKGDVSVLKEDFHKLRFEVQGNTLQLKGINDFLGIFYQSHEDFRAEVQEWKLSVEERIVDIPAIRKTVQEHAGMIGALQEKR